MKYIISMGFLGLIFLLSNCSTKEFNPPKEVPLEFNKTEEYNISDKLNEIKKPEKLNPLYIKWDGSSPRFLVVNNSQEATHILLAPQEYAKVGQVVEIAKAYKTIITDQEDLINQFVYKENLWKELLQMERQKAINYRELWVNSENMYRNEKWDHRLDNFINKSMFIITTLGGMSLFIFGGL